MLSQGWVQLGGPFDTEDECTVNCEGSSSSQISSSSSSCDVHGDYNVTWDESEQAWLYSDETISIRLWCDGSTFQLSVDCGSSTSSGGTGGPCCGCETVPSQYTMTVAGITDALCSFCNAYNGTFTLTLGDGCLWKTEQGNLCSGGFPSHVWQLSCDETNMYLRPQGAFATDPPGAITEYVLALSSWDCLGSNTLIQAFSSNLECNGWPASITINPV